MRGARHSFADVNSADVCFRTNTVEEVENREALKIREGRSLVVSAAECVRTSHRC